ncbi:MAG: HepT-like ribonuclease domain-containing protein [Pseudomonadota bacterium]
MKRDIVHLQHALECISAIEEYTRSGKEFFPWFAIAGFRNILVHDYLGINITQIWDIVDRDVPNLKSAVNMLVAELGPCE